MKTKKVSFNLPIEQIEFLQKTANQENMTFTDILCRAINAEMFFIEVEKKGNILLTENPKGIRKKWKRIKMHIK